MQHDKYILFFSELDLSSLYPANRQNVDGLIAEWKEKCAHNVDRVALQRTGK